jgi:hypothetical protein
MDLKELRKIYFECLCWQPDLMIDFLETKRKSMNYSLELFYKPLLQFHHDNLRNQKKINNEKPPFIDESGVLHSSVRLYSYNGFSQNSEVVDFRKIILEFLEASKNQIDRLPNINPVTMNNDINSIKHQFDSSLNHLNCFIPLINTMFVESTENKNFNLFEEAVKSFNFTVLSFQLYQSIENTISNAKLFLNENELQRFYLFAKGAIKIKREHLNSIIKSFDNELTETENFELEKIFHSNCNVGINNFPDIKLTGNTNFSVELIKAIQIYFENFENEIDKIRTYFTPSSEPISDPPQPENPFPKIFTDEGYRLFVKLQTSFISDDKRNVKVNYSYLYHYLNDDLHTHLLCTQDEYIGFINENYHVSLSKIQPKTTKYDDKVKKKLDGIRKNLSI